MYFIIEGILDKLRLLWALSSGESSSSANRNIFRTCRSGHMTVKYSRPAWIPRIASNTSLSRMEVLLMTMEV